MADVFILGAGFSIAVSPTNMPSTDDLGQLVVDMLTSIHRARIRDHSTICDGLSCDSPQLIDGKIPGRNFEVWLSRLAEAQPYFYDHDNFRLRSMYSELTDAIAENVRTATVLTCEQVIPSPDWFAQLLGAWHRSRSDVITFNYDTLVESRLDALRLPFDGNETLTYKRVAPSLIPHWQELWGGLRLEPGPTFSYMKLHGSIHWFWDPRSRSSESMVEIGLPAVWAEDADPKYDPKYRAPGKLPVIVPPTTMKTPFVENPIIRLLWRDAYEAIRSATRLFVVGYSLPEHDLLVSSMILEATRDRGTYFPTWVVNPDVEVADRLRDLNLTNISEEFTGDEDCVSRFVKWYASTV